MSDIIKGGYDLTKLARGAIRAVICDDPEGVSAPGDLSDVIDMINTSGGYPLKTGWENLGATTDASNYSRGMESEGYEIEQETGLIDEEITEVPRSLTLPLANIDSRAMQIIENASDVETVAAAAEISAQKKVPLGTFTDLAVYRVMFIGLRSIKAGAVIEPDLTRRGRMVAVGMHYCSLSADETTFEFGKGSLWSGEVTFQAFPDPDAPVGEEHGAWYFEDAGTIAAGP
jgi:hypothetical protein